MYVYDLKTMIHDEALSAITVEGLPLALGTSLRYRLLPNDVIPLHKQVRAAIDQKLVTEQQLLKTRYQMALAKANADLKQIEAAAIAAYNTTVRASLSAPLLNFERIQATSQLARSPNAKTVVIGQGTGSAPLLVDSR